MGQTCSKCLNWLIGSFQLQPEPPSTPTVVQMTQLELDTTTGKVDTESIDTECTISTALPKTDTESIADSVDTSVSTVVLDGDADILEAVRKEVDKIPVEADDITGVATYESHPEVNIVNEVKKSKRKASFKVVQESDTAKMPMKRSKSKKGAAPSVPTLTGRRSVADSGLDTVMEVTTTVTKGSWSLGFIVNN